MRAYSRSYPRWNWACDEQGSIASDILSPWPWRSLFPQQIPPARQQPSFVVNTVKTVGHRKSYSCSEKPRAQESFLKIKTLDLEVSKTLERGRAKN